MSVLFILVNRSQYAAIRYSDSSEIFDRYREINYKNAADHQEFDVDFSRALRNICRLGDAALSCKIISVAVSLFVVQII